MLCGMRHVLAGQYDIIRGGLTFFRLMHGRTDTHYLLLSPEAAETLCALSYLREYKRRWDHPHVTAIAWTDSGERLCAFYPERVDALVRLSRRKAERLEAFVKCRMGQRWCSARYKRRFTAVAFDCNCSRRLVERNPYISAPAYIRELLYQIGPDAAPERPSVPPLDAAAFAARYGLIKGRTVLLQPDGGPAGPRAPELFARLAAALRQEGRAVVTVTESPDAVPVPGTTALPCGPGEAYRLAEYGGTVVAARGGSLALAAFADCRFISVEDADDSARHYLDLREWGVNGDCHTVVYQDDETALRQIMRLMDR